MSVDKVYLHVQQGMMLQSKICELTDIFFSKVFGKSVPSLNLKTMLSTGTMRQDCVLLTSYFAALALSPVFLLWAKVDDFTQRNIAIVFHYTSAHTKHLDLVVRFSKKDAIHFACIVGPSKTPSFHLRKNIERKPNRVFLQVGNIHGHGPLAK